MPIIPARWEAEAGESLELGGRLQGAKIMSLHTSLATEEDSVSKQTNKKHFLHSLQYLPIRHVVITKGK